ADTVEDQGHGLSLDPDSERVLGEDAEALVSGHLGRVRGVEPLRDASGDRRGVAGAVLHDADGYLGDDGRVLVEGSVVELEGGVDDDLDAGGRPVRRWVADAARWDRGALRRLVGAEEVGEERPERGGEGGGRHRILPSSSPASFSKAFSSVPFSRGSFVQGRAGMVPPFASLAPS